MYFCQKHTLKLKRFKRHFFAPKKHNQKSLKFLRYRSFTLVELLIVIAVIAMIAVAVIATINPVEIIRRANDARRRADAVKLKTAIDSYYITMSSAPWGNNAFDVDTGYCVQTSASIPTECFIDGGVDQANILPFAATFWDGSNTTKSEISNIESIKEGSIYVTRKDVNDMSVYVCYPATSKSEQSSNNTDINCNNTATGWGGVECTCL